MATSTLPGTITIAATSYACRSLTAGGANEVFRIVVAGLDDGATSQLLALSSTAVLLCTGGRDGILGDDPASAADAVTLVSDIGGTPAVEHLATLGLLGTFSRAFSPQLLGGGRAAMIDPGPDGAVGEGDDDVVRIVEGLPRDRDLTATKVVIKFKADKPEKPANVTVKARVALDTPDLLTSGDVTVSIGNAAQTLAAAAFKAPK